MGEGSEGADCSSSYYRLFQIDTIIDESYVRSWVACDRAFTSEEVQDLALDMCVFTVLDMLRQDHQSVLSVRRANLHDSINDGLPEGHVRVILEAIREEL